MSALPPPANQYVNMAYNVRERVFSLKDRGLSCNSCFRLRDTEFDLWLAVLALIPEFYARGLRVDSELERGQFSVTEFGQNTKLLL